MFELKDRVIVLTGSTGVLVGALAKSFAKAQAKLVLLGRNQNGLKLTFMISIFLRLHYLHLQKIY